MDNDKSDPSTVENHAPVAAGGPLQFNAMALGHTNPGSLVFHVAHGKEVFRILPSGKVQIAEGIETDEAAKAFWEAVDLLGNPAREMIDQLEKRVDALAEAAQRAIKSSVPYIVKHNAFLISAEAWNDLNNLVTPGAHGLDDLLKRAARGERVTEEEIQRILEGGESNSAEP
jgi:predicted transcriptional regulator